MVRCVRKIFWHNANRCVRRIYGQIEGSAWGLGKIPESWGRIRKELALIEAWGEEVLILGDLNRNLWRPGGWWPELPDWLIVKCGGFYEQQALSTCDSEKLTRELQEQFLCIFESWCIPLNKFPEIIRVNPTYT